jgi:hypothetical protein
MRLLTLYLRYFNREYLHTPADRQHTWRTLSDFLGTLAAILLLAWLLSACQ